MSDPIRRIEVDFALPVTLTGEEYQALCRLVEGIARRHEPDDGVHWLAEVGDKPSYSAIDAAMLGVEPAPPESRPADGEEPTFDATVLHLATCSRPFVSEAERERRLRARAARSRSAPAENTKVCTECQGSCHYDYTMGQAAAEGDDCLACGGTGRMPEHGVYCTACQKVFDARDLTQVLYHQTHRPTPVLDVPPGHRLPVATSEPPPGSIVADVDLLAPAPLPGETREKGGG